MASPQLEDGFTRMANEILDHLVCSRFAGHEIRAILFVIRKTYGFNKKWDRIPISQFQKALGITDRAQTCRILKKLVALKPLLKGKNGYSFNKNWQDWKSTGSGKDVIVARRSTASGKEVYPASGIQATLKRNTKETIQKKSNVIENEERTVVDKSLWRPKPQDSMSAGATGLSRHDPPDNNDTKPPDTSTLEGNTYKKETHLRKEDSFENKEKTIEALNRIRREVVDKFSMG